MSLTTQSFFLLFFNLNWWRECAGFSPARPQVRVIDHVSPPRTAVPALMPSSTEASESVEPTNPTQSASSSLHGCDASMTPSVLSVTAPGLAARAGTVSATPSPARAPSVSVVSMSPFRPSLAARVHTDPIACLVRERSRQRDATIEGWVQELHMGEWLMSSQHGCVFSTCSGFHRLPCLIVALSIARCHGVGRVCAVVMFAVRLSIPLFSGTYPVLFFSKSHAVNMSYNGERKRRRIRTRVRGLCFLRKAT
jgi:hypothetical protein